MLNISSKRFVHSVQSKLAIPEIPRLSRYFSVAMAALRWHKLVSLQKWADMHKTGENSMHTKITPATCFTDTKNYMDVDTGCAFLQANFLFDPKIVKITPL